MFNTTTPRPTPVISYKKANLVNKIIKPYYPKRLHNGAKVLQIVFAADNYKFGLVLKLEQVLVCINLSFFDTLFSLILSHVTVDRQRLIC